MTAEIKREIDQIPRSKLDIEANRLGIETPTQIVRRLIISDRQALLKQQEARKKSSH